jgi:hypothetical protein
MNGAKQKIISEMAFGCRKIRNLLNYAKKIS